jgi:hypothetical protein
MFRDLPGGDLFGSDGIGHIATKDVSYAVVSMRSCSPVDQRFRLLPMTMLIALS